MKPFLTSDQYYNHRDKLFERQPKDKKMNPQEKLIQKLKEYNRYLKRAIHSEGIINNVTAGVRDKFESEIAALEKEISEEPKETIYDIDFGGHVLAGISVKNNNITIIGAINGYGNGIKKDEIRISQQTIK